MDIDDYWHISPGHPMYTFARKTNFAQCCIDQLKYSDYITTTHPYLRDYIIKEGIPKKKVFVCKNAIDPLESQFAQKFNYGNSIMWQGSSTHAMDLELLSDIDQPITLCGYVYSEEWFEMSSKIKHPLKKDHLSMIEYMNHYQETGISLIPLKDNKFNKFKSELKMIEAGWASKPVIVSKIHPYKMISNHMINCLEASTPDEFKKYTELLIKNPQLQEDLRGKLNEEVKSKYLIETQNEIRQEILKL
jgi:glycosyltransferase involved in cell wall biosynthesis